jgi:hypothetical protein
MNTQGITYNLKTSLIKNIIDTLNVSPLYLYYARPTDFINSVIPDVLDTTIGENEIKSNIMSLKRIRGSDVAPGFKKIEWSSGIIYDQYDSNINMVNKNFYVITNENKVFKCLNNGNGSASTFKPIENSGLLSDGYLWQFMFRIPSGVLRKFAYEEYLPVFEDSLIINSARPGTVDRIDILNSGQNYSVFYDGSALPYIPIFIKGDGIVNDSATVNLNVNSGEISNVNIIDGGSNYRIVSGKTVVPVMIMQKGAEREFVFSGGVNFDYAFGLAKLSVNGVIEDIEIILGGDNYTESEPATVVQSSSIAYANLGTSGGIESIDIEYIGSDFSIADAILVSSTGIGANLKVSLSPKFGHGAEPVFELNANNLLISTNVVLDENTDFTIENDFRQFGFMRDVLEFDAAGNIIAGFSSTLSAKESMSLDSPLDVAEDGIVFGEVSGAKALTVDTINNTVRVIRPHNNSNQIKFQLNEEIKSATGSATIVSVQKPEYVPHSGHILYINNIAAIERSDDQLETINFVLTF